MKKLVLFPLLLMSACAHQPGKRELSQYDRAWIVQECQARYPEPDKNSRCLIKLTDALINAYAGQSTQWGTTRKGVASAPSIGGTPVHRVDEFTGPVINGKCHGTTQVSGTSKVLRNYAEWSMYRTPVLKCVLN